jgi:undecaprenyl-diphosphatase
VPVSSSAQLTLLPWLLGWDEVPDRTTFAAALHAGSCAGIAWALRDEIRQLRADELALLAASSVPAAAAGLLAQDLVEERLGGRSWLAGLLAGAGVVLWLADRRPSSEPMSARAAGAAALAQVVALAPGVSRSGATLTALRLLQVDRAAAQRFSLLMSLPITAGAAGLTLRRADSRDLRRLGAPLSVGIPAAAVVAALSTAGQRRRGGVPVGLSALYRLALAAAVVRRNREQR